MSDTAVQEPIADRQPKMKPELTSPDIRSFDYVPVPVSAIVGLVLSVVGLFGIFALLAVPLAVFGVLVSLAAWWTIRRSDGAFGGKGVAIAGIVVGLVGSIGGVTRESIAYRNEVPENYERVSFKYDISDPGVERGLAPNGQPGIAVPDDVMELVGKNVFVKGYMYPDPDNRTKNIESFLLVKDLGDCCFGGEPAITDMIGIEFPEDEALRATFYEQTKVGVGGKFKVREDYAFGANEPVYAIEATHFDLSKSSF